MNQIINIAGYKFIKLSMLESLRENFRNSCQGLKGTILLSSEGINIMVAGEQQSINQLMKFVKNDSRFANIEFKKSYSSSIPFKRLLVKIKKQIIPFDANNINPENFTAPSISPKDFKAWLDSNKELVILDTRNECEISYGTFKNAIHLQLNDFRSFPKKAKKITAMKAQPIVTFCTGGIRCEKAAAYLLQQGFKEVYQLRGGILQYFAECGAAYYEGQCFVFDERVSINVNDIAKDL